MTDHQYTTWTMTRPWAEIVDFYRRLAQGGMDIGAMLGLAERIEGSSYARGLHAWTSMHDLCIVQVPGSDAYDGPRLRISPRFDGTIEFRYIDTPNTEKQWHRVVREEDAFQRLEHFIDQLHWVVREKRYDA